MPHDYRYDPFNDTSEAIAITGETHVIPSNSPYTIRLNEVPMKDTPSSISLTIGGVAANEVSAPPAAGEFWPDYSTKADNDDNWNTGTILFNAADAGKTVVVSYIGTGTLVDTRTVHGQAIFTESGAWICPEGITEVFISICGGGGGGGGASGTASYCGGGGGGGGSQAYLKKKITVVPGTEYTITIGAGGNGGAGGTSPGDGGDGGATSFSSLLTAAGGKGGKRATSSSSYRGNGGDAGGSGGARGGDGGQAYAGSYRSGNGGGCLLGPGEGSRSYSSNPGAGIDCTCYGGGGSGGMSALSNSGYAGGAGGPGICIIEW